MLDIGLAPNGILVPLNRSTQRCLQQRIRGKDSGMVQTGQVALTHFLVEIID